MIDNYPFDARPQSGLHDAEIVYEVEAEGGGDIQVRVERFSRVDVRRRDFHHLVDPQERRAMGDEPLNLFAIHAHDSLLARLIHSRRRE